MTEGYVQCLNIIDIHYHFIVSVWKDGIMARDMAVRTENQKSEEIIMIPKEILLSFSNVGSYI